MREKRVRGTRIVRMAVVVAVVVLLVVVVIVVDGWCCSLLFVWICHVLRTCDVARCQVQCCRWWMANKVK